MTSIKVFVDTKCGPSKALAVAIKKTTLEVEYVILESDPHLVKELNIISVPTSVVFGSDNQIIAKIVGEGEAVIKRLKELSSD